MGTPQLRLVPTPDVGTKWQDLAACQDKPPDWFFPDAYGDTEPAKIVCATCPVREPCLEYALELDQPGMWAGTTERERKALRRAARAAGEAI